jgi:DNA-binding HxlR family transcriptional regulator
VARRESAARKARGTHDEPVAPAERGRPSAARAAANDAEATAGAGTGALALDRIIHERMRLGIVSALAADESLTFTELRGLLQTSDGNLSVHARKLEEAGYVSCRKGFEGRVPRTEYRLTSAGRKALARYLDHMEALIRAARER